jgi:hypothetical protein
VLEGSGEGGWEKGMMVDGSGDEGSNGVGVGYGS